ncbi:MAG: ParB N-terminal domain-containing protein [Phycisphaerae bacterium]
MNTLQIEYVRPDSLTPAAWNPRTIGRDALQRLAQLLDAHGFAQPVVARREDGLVLGGHQRLAANALRDQPDDRVPVIFLDRISDDQARALNIALNNDQAQGRFEAARLAELLEQIHLPEDELARQTAFSRAQLAALAEQVGAPAPLEDVLPGPDELESPGPDVTILLEATAENYQQLRRQLDDWIAAGLVDCHVRMDRRESGRCR